MEKYNKPLNEASIEDTKNKIHQWLDKVKNYVSKNWHEFQDASRREKKETIVAIHILQNLIMGKEVSDSQKRFLKAQTVDLLKILVLVAFKFIPSPIPITVLAVWLGKKMNINVLPSSHLKGI